MFSFGGAKTFTSAGGVNLKKISLTGMSSKIAKNASKYVRRNVRCHYLGFYSSKKLIHRTLLKAIDISSCSETLLCKVPFTVFASFSRNQPVVPSSVLVIVQYFSSEPFLRQTLERITGLH